MTFCRCISMPPSMALRIGTPSTVLQLVRPADGAEFIGGLFADRGRDGSGSLFGQVVPGILNDANDQVVGVAPDAGQAARGEREVALSGQKDGRDRELLVPVAAEHPAGMSWSTACQCSCCPA